MQLSRLLKHCLNTQYTHIENAADFSVQRLGNDLYIYFAHSDGREDWKNNLDFPARAFNRDGKAVWFAHRGYLKVWSSIADYISADIMDSSVKKITVVGYSHGAALALLCHEYVWNQRPDLREMSEGYGFGCPRVIWGILPTAVRRRWEHFTVIRNIDDIVTHLPPNFLGYTHIGRLLEIGKRGKYSRIDAHRAENILDELIEYEKTKPKLRSDIF